MKIKNIWISFDELNGIIKAYFVHSGGNLPKDLKIIRADTAPVFNGISLCVESEEFENVHPYNQISALCLKAVQVVRSEDIVNQINNASL